MATKKTDKEKAFNIYGLRRTKNEKYFSLTLCRGEDKPEEWVNSPVKADNVKVKADNVKVKDGYAYIKVKLLTPKAAEPKDDFPF